MNSRIKAILGHNEPKLDNLNEKEMNIYKLGLTVISQFVCEEFLDLDPLPRDRFSKEGLFFTIPYYDDNQLWCSDNQRVMIVIYKVTNENGRMGSICPLRIDFKMEEGKDFKVIVYNQNLPSTLKRNLISYEDGQYYTEIEGHDKLKLSELLKVDTESSKIDNTQQFKKIYLKLNKLYPNIKFKLAETDCFIELLHNDRLNQDNSKFDQELYNICKEYLSGCSLNKLGVSYDFNNKIEI